MPCFADVILPLPLPQYYTYRVPEALTGEAGQGRRAIVPFGTKKYYTALIVRIHQTLPEAYETKNIEMILDKHPVVDEKTLVFWEWMAHYYMCTVGEVMRAALPAGLKLESETHIHRNPEFDQETVLEEKEYLLYDLLKNNKDVSIQEINQLWPGKNALPQVKSLLEKKAVFIHEKVKEKYQSKTVTYVRLSPDYRGEAKLNQVLDDLAKAPAQLRAIMGFLSLTGMDENALYEPVKKKDLLDKTGVSAAVIKTLEKKGIFIFTERVSSRLDLSEKELHPVKELSGYQDVACREIRTKFEHFPVVLLHGITSSGKTEIYIHLIQEMLEQGKQVLYLLPEIALTAQIIHRLKSVFGNKTGIYHSRYSDSERVEIWNQVLHNNKKGYQVILGARSSVFLPFQNLGLVIVDEEHENSFKQYDPAPRYHARDAAIYLAQLYGAKTLLGSATPSLETYFNTEREKYGRVSLTRRYQEIQLPEIILANTREAYRKKKMQSMFTPVLLEHMEKALEQKEQVILFQNRRGFSPYMECTTCGWIPYCKHCNVSLTYHKYSRSLVCHYCGYSTKIPDKCGECGALSVNTRGFGTEKIEEEVQLFFPDAKIARLDMDTTRSRRSYEKIITDFELGYVDILVGTQMITKGLDFDRVNLVGILNADNMLNFPDFRSFERSFQLMSQVSGRAGRKYKQGKVIVQTGDPSHPVIRDVLNHDYLNMFRKQLTDRKNFKYPPFFRLINLGVRHKNKETLHKAANLLAENLRKTFGNRVIGPEAPLVDKIQNWYIKNIWIKIERDKSVSKAKYLIRQHMDEIKTLPAFKSLQVIPDVDPM